MSANRHRADFKSHEVISTEMLPTCSVSRQGGRSRDCLESKMSPCQPPVLRRWLLPVVVVSIIAAACAGAGDAVGVDAGFAPPDACAAGEVPVEAANRPFVFLVCGQPYVDPMYPAPASWFGDGSGIEEVLGYLVAGTSGRSAELGLWSGFDALTRAERDGIGVEYRLRPAWQEPASPFPEPISPLDRFP